MLMIILLIAIVLIEIPSTHKDEKAYNMLYREIEQNEKKETEKKIQESSESIIDT